MTLRVSPAARACAVALCVALVPYAVRGHGGGVRYAGCPVFPPGDSYNRDVSGAPVDPNSGRYIAGMVQAGNTSGFWAAAEPVEYVNVAGKRTPMRRIVQKVRFHQFSESYPWDGTFVIEPLSDAHAIVVQPDTCRLYELYDATFSGGTLSAYSGHVWNLRAPFVPLPPGNPSSMASGLSLFAGMVKWEEIERGSIDHALNWAAPVGTTAQYAFVRPASATDGLPFRGSTPYQIPYGARLRLHRDFDTSRFPPQARAIAQAMKTYGIFLADTGSKGNAIYNAVPATGPGGWNASDLGALGSIHITDFDVLHLPAVERVPGH